MVKALKSLSTYASYIPNQDSIVLMSRILLHLLQLIMSTTVAVRTPTCGACLKSTSFCENSNEECLYNELKSCCENPNEGCLPSGYRGFCEKPRNCSLL